MHSDMLSSTGCHQPALPSTCGKADTCLSSLVRLQRATDELPFAAAAAAAAAFYPS